MTTTDLETAAASTVEEAAAACEKLDELMMGRLAGCFARVEPRRQARKYVAGLISDVPHKNCWALAEQAGVEYAVQPPGQGTVRSQEDRYQQGQEGGRPP